MTKPRPPLGQRIKHKGHHHYRPKVLRDDRQVEGGIHKHRQRKQGEDPGLHTCQPPGRDLSLHRARVKCIQVRIQQPVQGHSQTAGRHHGHGYPEHAPEFRYRTLCQKCHSVGERQSEDRMLEFDEAREGPQVPGSGTRSQILDGGKQPRGPRTTGGLDSPYTGLLESHQSTLTSIQAKRRPYLVYSGLDLRRHHDVLGPTTPVTFCRPPGRGIHAHLGSPRRGGRRMIQFIQRSLTHKYVTFRIHVAEDPPGHLRIVVHIHLGIYHNYELSELHLTRSPNRVHDLARVHGVGFAYRKDSAVVEDTLLRQIHIHNLRQGHLQKW